MSHWIKADTNPQLTNLFDASLILSTFTSLNPLILDKFRLVVDITVYTLRNDYVSNFYSRLNHLKMKYWVFPHTETE